MSAAFLAPVVTIFAFLQLVWTDLASAFRRFLLRHVIRGGHTIVVGGMGGARGQVLIHDTLARGKRVVAIDRCDAVVPAGATQEKRLHYICGEAGSADILRRSGAARAADIIVFCGEDHENISISRTIADHISAAGGAHPENLPRIICHANASRFRDQVVDDQSLAVVPVPKIEFYSPEEAAARQFVLSYPPPEDMQAGLGIPARILRSSGGMDRLRRCLFTRSPSTRNLSVVRAL